MGKSVVLVAHNCFMFNMRVLVNAAQREGVMNELEEWVSGFSDALPVLKARLAGKESYSLPVL